MSEVGRTRVVVLKKYGCKGLGTKTVRLRCDELESEEYGLPVRITYSLQ